MREYNIKTSPIIFLAIVELKIDREINQHGKIVMTGYIKDEEEEEYLKILSEEVWEKVEEVGDKGDIETLFWGIVTNFSVITDNDQKKMTLEITTGSCLLDMKRHIRSYQDRTMTYKQMCKQLIESYAEGGAIFNSPLVESIGELVLQYYETDWEFIKRMASRKHQFWVVESKIKGEKLFYGLPKGKEWKFPKDGKYIIKKDLSEYRKKKIGGITDIREVDSLVYSVQCREYRSIGDYVMIQRRKFNICRMQGNYVNGEMLFDYELRQEKGMDTLETWQEKMVGCSIEAIVLNVKEDKVQVGILEDENEQQEINIWYPYATVYSTPDGTGWYCMPEPGDRVRITVPGKKESEAFVTSSVHMGKDIVDRKNPNVKSLKSKYQKEVRFTPNSIVITNNQGTKIELTDAEGIHIVSAHSILLEAAEDITISSDSGSLIVAGTSKVNLEQKGTSINLSNGISFIGGELKVQ